MKRGDIAEAPWNDDETEWFRVRIESSSVSKKGSHASVVWLAGPLKGREARINSKSLRMIEETQECEDKKVARQSRRALRNASREEEATKTSARGSSKSSRVRSSKGNSSPRTSRGTGAASSRVKRGSRQGRPTRSSKGKAKPRRRGV